MSNIVLYRSPGSEFEEEELPSIADNFVATHSRLDVKAGDLVIGRYSVLPFYKELDADIKRIGAKLINSYAEHRYIADISQWAYDLEGLTPKTYSRLSEAPGDGPWIVKGETNSKKYLWNSHMFAKNRREAAEIVRELQNDGVIGSQRIFLRDYVPLYKLGEGTNGLPISEEYRFFVLYGKILTGAFYWSSHSAELKDAGLYPLAVDDAAYWLEAAVLPKIADKASFVVVDVARTAKGDWTVVELNDGQMSGLSDNKPEDLYGAMKRVLDEKA